MSIADKLLMSGLQRHVRICDTVLNSDEFLSAGDRCTLIQNLLAEKVNPSITEINARCAIVASDNLEGNMVAAQILNSSRY